ncbi:MAG: hypothetical protein OSB41_12370 [Kiritimatiellae bacterium]|nr:hypothetical protein [Kiritimatiellia bacterium]
MCGIVILCSCDAAQSALDCMSKLGKGIYTDKSTSVTKPEWVTKFCALGNDVSAWDEKGLVYLSEAVYHGTRMCDEAFELVDLFYSWGASHTRTVEAGYSAAVPPRTLGQEALIAESPTGRDGQTVCEGILEEIETRELTDGFSKASGRFANIQITGVGKNMIKVCAR